jgi:hypothetical protein
MVRNLYKATKLAIEKNENQIKRQTIVGVWFFYYVTFHSVSRGIITLLSFFSARSVIIDLILFALCLFAMNERECGQ